MGNVLQALKHSKMVSQPPIIVILGCTGTGKSNLAIELAKKFDGEIISADSMQVYKSLDIITNKVTPAEQAETVHHCINIIDPPSRYTVVDFRNHVLPIIEKLFKYKKLPIIVGGTNYYIESILWNVLIKVQNEEQLLFDNKPSTPPSLTLNAENIFKHEITADSFEDIPGSELHKLLQEIDPKMADMLHPEDKRKIIRSLQVYQQHGQCHSDIIKEQCSQDGGSSLGGPLRYKNTVMLWIQCDKEVLNKRLDDRVEDMLKKGLINELLDFHAKYNEQRLHSEKAKYTEGIFQSIGFKEFHNYLTLPKEERESEKGSKIFKQSIEEMKLGTRQYARKQKKWIVNRFLRKPDRQLPPVYGLNGTDLILWKENVIQPALDIVQTLMEGKTPVQKPLPLESPINDIKETHYCEICERVFVGRKVWEIHLGSKKHYKRKLGLQKLKKKNS